MKRGRPPFRTEEEKKAAKRRIHTRAMRECKWHCEVCQREYSLGCKTNHLNTKKHQRNYYNDKLLVEI